MVKKIKEYLTNGEWEKRLFLIVIACLLFFVYLMVYDSEYQRLVKDFANMYLSKYHF